MTSKESYYQDAVLTERRYFDIEGRFTGWVRFNKSTQNRMIVTELSVEKESYGQITSQEEWSFLDQEGGQTAKSRLMRKWHYTKEAPVTLEYIGHHEQIDPFREVRKDYLNKEKQIISSIFLYNKDQDEKPYAFIEKDPRGKVLSEFSLYEKYDLVGSLKKAGLTADEIAVLKSQRENPNRFLVAIIDSGFDYNHKELVSKWWNNPQDPMDGIDNDGNGWVDDNFGWEQVRNVGLPTESSIGMHKDHRPLSHGTHVAHIASRGLNNIALVGFAGDYTRADYIRKMSEFIKKHQVRIVNMSLGFTKNGVSAAAPYQEQPAQEIFLKYRSQEGRECKKLGINRQDCRLAQMAYRCVSLEEFMNKHGGLNVFEKDLLIEVSRLEKIVQSQMLDQKNLNVNIEPTLERLTNKVLELKARGSSLIVTDYFESRLESLEYR